MAVTYRLKDRELQKKLDELTDGDFSKGLAETMNEDQSSLPHISVDCGKWINPQAHERFSLFRFRIFLGKDEIEVVPVYDPKAWNEYPAVEPPEGVWMRFEYKCVNDDLKDIEPCCNDDEPIGVRLIYRNGEWRNSRNSPLCTNIIREVRFRPWDDDETER